MPEPPIELVWLRYRQKFNLSWTDFLATPYDVMVQDLQILDLEAMIKSRRVEKPKQQ